ALRIRKIAQGTAPHLHGARQHHTNGLACSVSVACWAKLGAAQSEAVMKTLVISARRNCPVVRILVSSPRAVVWSPLICVGATVVRERPRCQHHSFLHE
ncbi:MAG: hypothetical protein RSG56_10500, partial [Brevundimonas sp.]